MIYDYIIIKSAHHLTTFTLKNYHEITLLVNFIYKYSKINISI